MSHIITDGDIADMRLRKAERIAGAVVGRGLTPTDAARLGADARRQIEKQAGIRVGSSETWRIVVDILAGSARIACPTCGHGDPSGSPGPVKTFGHDGACAR